MKKKFIFLALLISIIGIMLGQITLFEEDFEGAGWTPTGNGTWHIVNNATGNRWMRESFGHNDWPSNAMLVSVNGTTHTYESSTANSGNVWFYRDITLPANAINVTMTLDVVCYGESSTSDDFWYDFVRVYLYDTTHTPEATQGGESGHIHYNVDPDPVIASFKMIQNWEQMTISIPAAMIAGQTKRLTFRWRCDGSVTNQPPGGIDNIVITYSEASNEPSPALLVAPSNNATNIFIQQTLQWAPQPEGAQPTGYKIHFGTTPTPPFISDLGLVTSWTPNPPLQWNSTYYWQVIPYNAFGDAMNCAIWTFSTGVDPTIISFPHQEFFDTISVGDIPYGWDKVISLPPSTGWVIEAVTTAPVLSPPNHLRLYNGTGSADAVVIARTPPIQNLSGKRVKFYARGASTGYTLDVGYMTDPSSHTSFVLVETITITSTTYNQPENFVSFAGATGDFIAFRHGGGGTGRTMFIDNVTIENIPQGADFYTTTTHLDFGVLEFGTPTSRIVNYQNLGSANLIINHGTLPTDMTVNMPNPITIGPSSNQDVIYTVTATTEGTYSSTITMTTNAGNAPNYSITASGYVPATLPPQAFVVGDGDGITILQNGSTNTWRTPAELFYRNSYIQTVYLAEELGFGPGLITSIWYNWNGNNHTNNEYHREWQIWMENTAVSEFTEAAWIDPTSLEEVFNGTVYFFSDMPGWMQIELDNPFVYTGQNILIAVYKTPTGGSYTDSMSGFYSTPTTTTRSLGVRNDTNPSTWTPSNPQTPVRLDGFPNTAFIMEIGDPGPVMTVAPNNFNFGNVNQNETVTRIVSIGNVGDAPLTASFTNPLPPYITVSNTGTITIAPNGSEQITITFSPTTDTPIGDYSAALNITSNSIMIPDRSIQLTAQVLPVGLFYIGDGNTNQFLPAYTSYWGYTYSQTIYYADQINTAGLITYMYFYWNGSSQGNLCDLWDFYLTESNITSFEASTLATFIPINEFTQVFSGTLTLPSIPGWVGFMLDEPFMYSGTGNLVLAANEKTSGYTGANWFHGTADPTTTNRAIRISRDGTEPYDPELLLTYSSGPARMSGFANMGLLIVPPEPGPMMIVSPSSLNYGLVNQGSVYNLTITISNIGDALLSASINPATLPGIVTVSSAGPFNIAPDTFETVTVTLSPTDATPLFDFSGTMDITSDSVLMPERNIPITAHVLPEGLVAIGTGTAQNTIVPISTGWGHSYTQTIYLASEMQGMAPSHQITQIAYHYNGHNSFDYINQWAVYMGHTDATSFASDTADAFLPQSEMMNVFTGTIPLTTTAGWVYIELDVPFPYIVGQNLVIGVNNITPISTYNGSANFQATNQSGSNRGIRVARDNSTPYDLDIPLTGSIMRDSNPPNIRLLFYPIEDGAYFIVSPSNVNFGSIPEGMTVERTILFRNIGNEPVNLTLSNIPANITLDIDNTLTIDAETDLPVTLIITATEPGPFTGVINITSNANNGPNHVINLQAHFTPERLVQIGFGTIASGTANYMPWDFYYRYSYGQTIYLPDEINMPAGVITDVYFHYNGNAAITEDIQIYLASTTQSTFNTTSSWVPLTEDDLYYSGPITTTTEPPGPDNNWVGVQLTQPFIYDSTQNLVIAINDQDNQMPGSGNIWYQSTVTGNRTLSARNDTNPYSALPPATGLQIARIPNTRLQFGPPIEGGYFLMSPSTVNFGGVSEGMTAQRTVLFRNIGNEPVEVTIANVPANVTLDCDDTFTIDADDEIEVTLTITATIPGPYTGVINITSDATNGPNHVLNLAARFTPEGLLQIGYGSIASGSNNYMPWDFFYRYSYGQTIYLAEELNMPEGVITEVYFHYNGNAVITENIEIYMGYTTQNSFASNSDWVPLTAADLYYSGPITTTNQPPDPENNWVGVQLTTPFVFSPNQNIVIAINDTDSQMPGSSNVWYQEAVPANRTLSARNDGSAYTALPPATGTMIGRIPNTRLQFGPPIEGPYISVAPTTFNFGNMWQYATVTGEFTITNIGNEDLTLQQFNSTPNIAVTPPQNMTLTPGTSIVVNFSFTPANPETNTGSIVITSNASNGSRTINMTAWAREPLPPGITQVGFGESTQAYIPWDYYWNDYYNQQIYLPTEMGLAAGDLITSIAYEYNGNSNQVANVKIYMGYTSFNDFNGNDWVPFTDLTLVYENATLQSPGGGPNWVTMEFDEPFEYDDTQNLVVAVLGYINPYTISSPQYYYDIIETTRTIYAYANYTNGPQTFDPASPPNPSGRYARITNTRFTYDESTFPRPRNLRGVAGNNMVNLEWDPPIIPDGEIGVQIPTVIQNQSFILNENSVILNENSVILNENSVILNEVKNLRDASFLSMTKKDVSSRSETRDVSSLNMTRNTRNYTNFRVYRNGAEIAQLPAEDLTYVDGEVINGNSYIYYVTAIYDDGESSPSNTIILTPTGPIYHPPANLSATSPNGNDLVFTWQPGEFGLHENFETASLNPNWINYDQDGDGNIWEIVTNDYKEGNSSIISRSVSQNGNPLTPNNWLISSPVLITSNSFLNFWIGATNTNQFAETYLIKISTTGSDPADFTHTILNETLSSAGWQRRSLNLTQFANQTVYIAFQHISPTPQSAIKLDGVQVVKPVQNTSPGFQGYRIYISEFVLATITGNTTSYTVPNAPSGSIYSYYVTTWYGGDDESYPGNALYYNGTTDDLEETIIPLTTELKGNYPNPFNPETTISFSLAHESNLRLDIFNIKGQRVINLIDEIRKPGEYKVVWNGTDNSGRQIASGIYFYRMQTDDYSAIKRMILLK